MNAGKTALLALAALLAVTATSWTSPVVAEDNWELLGKREVAFKDESDSIEVTAKEGRFVAIQFKVEDGNLEMYDIKVIFGNDESYSPDVRHEFKEDSRSRVIDLPGEARVIKRVNFKYSSRIRKGRAEVKLFGKQAGGPGPDKPGPDKPDLGKRFPNYEHIGARKVDFVADHDEIEVTAKEGRFTSVMIEVEDADLTLWDIKFVFGNDDVYKPDTRFEFKEGTRSRQIDLPGEARVIRKVEFWYKSHLRDGKATINLYGKGPGADKPGPDKPALPERDKRFPGYKHLASRTVDFGRDTDVIVLGETHGRITSITIEVEDGEIEMHDFTVTFGNGKQHSPEVRHEFKEGSRSRVIDLPGEGRVIERIAFKYRSTKLKEGKAVINVYGK
ncbi:MAG: hypothetical protein IT463_10875 [Planctomycetes bacterium]|nr:hypothetical protein [Planctomycetota bacterium]